MEIKDYYAVLGVSPGVDQKEIRRAYRRLIKLIHPDSQGGIEDPAVGHRVAELVEAWRVLGDKGRRAAYDRARLCQTTIQPAGHVANEQPVLRANRPKPTVRPAGWVVEPWEIEGAPRSLLLQFSVSNEGIGSLSGSIEAPRWVRVAPSNFGPLTGGGDPQRVTIQFDGQSWKDNKLKDIDIWIYFKGGIGKKATVVHRCTLEQGGFKAGSRYAFWILAGVAMLGVGPLLALLAGIFGSIWAIFPTIALALPYLLNRLRRWEISAVGFDEEAHGWDLSSALGNVRLAVLALTWTLFGWILGRFANGTIWHIHIGELSPWITALGWSYCSLSLLLSDGWRKRIESASELLVPLICPLATSATALAWALSFGVGIQVLVGWLIYGAFEIGATIGWALGVMLMLVRGDITFARWLSKQLSLDDLKIIANIKGF